MAKGIYLDNNMTTRPSDKAISRMLPYFTDFWGVPSAPHLMGQEVFPAMEESYKAIYKLLGAKESDNFVFTSSGAEAVNHVFLSAYMDITNPTGKNHYVISNIDEAPALMSIARLEQIGCVGKMANANAKGQMTAQAIAEAITPRTALVSLSWANGLTGVINPVSEIAAICKQRGIPLHLDATHVLGKMFFDLNEVGATFITFNGDHIHAPKGTGGLWIKEGIKCSPLIVGGLEQAGLRAGNLNVPGLVALGHAATEALDARDLVCTEVARLRGYFESEIAKNIPEAVIYFRNEERLPNCTAIAFPGIPNEMLLYALNRRNVFASIGGGSFQQIGLVLAASGVPEIEANSAINFSLSRETTEDEIDRAVAILTDTVKRLKKLSQKIAPEPS